MIVAAVFLIAAIAILAWWTGIGTSKTTTIETEEGTAVMPRQIDR